MELRDVDNRFPTNYGFKQVMGSRNNKFATIFIV